MIHCATFFCLADVLFYGSSVDVPDGWSKINISDYQYGYYLKPKVSSSASVCPSGKNCTDLGFYVIKTNNSQNLMMGALDYSEGQAVYDGNYTYYQGVSYPSKIKYNLYG